MIKDAELKLLDEAAEKCVEDNGTLYTEIFMLDINIRHQIVRCMATGAKRSETDAIIAKYSQGK